MNPSVFHYICTRCGPFFRIVAGAAGLVFGLRDSASGTLIAGRIQMLAAALGNGVGRSED